MALEYGDLTEQIIGAAIRVHSTLGPGFLESIYENSMVIELRKAGLNVQQQLEVPIKYDGIKVGLHRIDLLIETTIVAELKAIRDFEDIHFAIVRSYLRSISLDHGLLVNFGKLKLDVKRVSSRPR